jgi:hypothetical protein
MSLTASSEVIASSLHGVHLDKNVDGRSGDTTYCVFVGATDFSGDLWETDKTGEVYDFDGKIKTLSPAAWADVARWAKRYPDKR